MKNFVKKESHFLGAPFKGFASKVVLPSQIRYLIQTYTCASLLEAQTQTPPILALGEADNIYFNPIYSLAKSAQDSLSINSKGQVDFSKFEMGSIIKPLMMMGTVLNASVVYLLNSSTKLEMDTFSRVKAYLNQFSKDTKASSEGEDLKIRDLSMFTNIDKMMTDAASLLKWMSKTPKPTFMSNLDPDSFGSEILSAVLNHGGTGFVRQASIRSVPEIMAKRYFVTQVALTLMRNATTWMDGYALFLAYQTFAYLTKDPATYDSYFVRFNAPTSAAYAASHARLAQQTGYHLLTVAIAPMSLLFMFNSALLNSEVDVLSKIHDLSPSEKDNMTYAREGYEKYSSNFSFNIVKSTFQSIMTSLKSALGTDTLISTRLNGLIGDPISSSDVKMTAAQVDEYINDPEPLHRKEIDYDRSHYANLLADNMQRLSNTVRIINDSLQHVAVAGTELQVNSLQLPADAIPTPEDSFFDISILVSPTSDRSLSSLIDSADSFSIAPSKIQPLNWKIDPESNIPIQASTIFDEYRYEFIDSFALMEEMIDSVLSREPAFKWPVTPIPVEGLPISTIGRTFIPFNYVMNYDAVRIKPQKMKTNLPMFTSQSDRMSRMAIEEGYASLRTSDLMTKTAYADAWLSIGLLYEIDQSLSAKCKLISPSVPFAYGYHITAFMAKMGLSAELNTENLQELINSKKLLAFKDCTNEITDEVFLQPDDDIAAQKYVLIQYSHLPKPCEITHISGLISHTAFFPVPISTRHFGTRAAVQDVPSVKYSTDWFFDAMSVLSEENGKLNLLYGKQISTLLDKAKLWEPHYGYSRYLVMLPHLSFKVEGSPMAQDFLNSIEPSSLFTDHSHLNDLPYQKFVISKRLKNVIMLEGEDFMEVKKAVESMRYSTNSSTSTHLRVDKPASNQEKTAAELLSNLADKKEATATDIVVSSSNPVPSKDNKTTSELIETSLDEVGQKEGTIIPPAVNDKQVSEDDPAVDDGTVNNPSDNDEMVGSPDVDGDEDSDKKKKKKQDSKKDKPQDKSENQ